MKFKLAALVLGIVFVAAPRTALAYSAPGPVQDIWTENMPGTVTFVLSYGMPQDADPSSHVVDPGHGQGGLRDAHGLSAGGSERVGPVLWQFMPGADGTRPEPLRREPAYFQSFSARFITRGSRYEG